MRIADFRAALRDFQSRSDKVLRGRGMTPQRYLLLIFIKGALDGTSRPTMSELRNRMKLSPNTVTDLVARAEEAGLVAREAGDGDLRFVHVKLTPAGERELDGALLATAEDRRDFARRFEVLAQAFRVVLRQ